MPQVVKYRTAHILINTQTNYLNISLQARAVPLGGGHSSTVENWSPGEVAKTPTQNNIYIYIYFFCCKPTIANATNATNGGQDIPVATMPKQAQSTAAHKQKTSECILIVPNAPANARGTWIPTAKSTINTEAAPSISCRSG